MKAELKLKIHNRFDITVTDKATGEVAQTAQAENIILDNMKTLLMTAHGAYGSHIMYGKGTGTLSKTRTTLFNQLGRQSATVTSVDYSTTEACKSERKCVIPLGTHTGEIITEVGLSMASGNATLIVTHALLEDSEGNPVTIGPLTEMQEVTIYATTYASATGTDIDVYIDTTQTRPNMLLAVMLGVAGSTEFMDHSSNLLRLQTNKSPTQNNTNYLWASGAGIGTALQFQITTHDIELMQSRTNKTRFGTTHANYKVWSMVWGRSIHPTYWPICRTVFPNSIFNGYQFTNKAIGTGDGTTTVFNLPWSDIDTTKAYAFKVDGITLTEGTDYTLTNGLDLTSLTFATAPANNTPITGDWWVGYIPKDTDHVIDVQMFFTYSWEGA